VDPNDSMKYYYSYYAAHHINKVLFRTEPSLGLLHRMRAKNPLNNMTIVGDVHYYVVNYRESKKKLHLKTEIPSNLSVVTDYFHLGNMIRNVDRLLNVRNRLDENSLRSGSISNFCRKSASPIFVTISKNAFDDYMHPKGSVGLDDHEIKIESRKKRRSFDDAFSDNYKVC
jgi:hypothetical protein